MSRRLILTLSVGLNLLLVVVLLYTNKVRPAPFQNVVTDTPPPASNIVRTVVRKQFFSWQELESPDYQAYVKNLRDIGCPEQTIRDIIIADVNQLYAWKRLTEVISPDQEWWRSQPNTNLVAAASAKRLALEDERRNLLSSLLGTNWEANAAPLTTSATLSGPLLGDLSVDAKRLVYDILTRSQQRTQTYLDAQNNAGKKPDPATLAKLDQQVRVELAQVLNPAQLEEFLLRNSATAMNLRRDLVGLDATPDEFRGLFRLVDPLNMQIVDYANSDQQSRDDYYASFAKQYQDDLKSILGPERFSEYRVAHDPVYRDAMAQAEEAGATSDAADSLYLLYKAVQTQRSSILNNAGLTDDQKTQQLNLLAQQQQSSSDQILGLQPAQPAPATPPLPPTPPLPTQVHAYTPGESIQQISAQYGVPVNAIINANPNVNFNGLIKGTQIAIPQPVQNQ